MHVKVCRCSNRTVLVRNKPVDTFGKEASVELKQILGQNNQIRATFSSWSADLERQAALGTRMEPNFESRTSLPQANV